MSLFKVLICVLSDLIGVWESIRSRNNDSQCCYSISAGLLGDLDQCKKMFEAATENDSNALFVYNEPSADNEDPSFDFLYQSGK